MAHSRDVSISAIWLQEMKEVFKNDVNRADAKKEYTEEGASIFAVPESLRKERPGAYVPRVVSLGPFHHFKSEFSKSESYKNELIFRIIENANGKLDFIKLVHKLSTEFGDRLRKSYELLNEEYNTEVVGWIMARDALFLLDVLGSDFHSGNTSENVHVAHKIFDSKRKGPLLLAMQADILKMENQIPIFVLEEVLEWQGAPEGTLRDLLDAAFRGLSPFVKTEETSYHGCDDDLGQKHMLEYLYNRIVSPSMRTNHLRVSPDSEMTSANDEDNVLMGFVRKRFRCCSSNRAPVDLPSSTELRRRGVKFEALTTGNLDDIRFDRKLRIFYLPAIRMDDRTEVVLRNLVAHEALVELQTRALLSYVDLMDRLIDTPGDVAVLKRCGVFRSHMGSDKELANAWNGMGRSMWKSGYAPVDKAVNQVIVYYKSKYRVIFAEFMQAHFSKPWRAASLFGACILLALTFLQTFLQFEQLRLQNKHGP